MNRNDSFEFSSMFTGSYQGMNAIPLDPEDMLDDPLSAIPVDPLVAVHYIQDKSGEAVRRPSHKQAVVTTDRTCALNEDVVLEQLVAQSAHAEPWVTFNPERNGFLPKAPVPSTGLSLEPCTVKVQDESVIDSGYASQSLVCTVCFKTFKNRAEQKKHSSTHTRPFKCTIPRCTNMKGFATSNDLERHQKDIHFMRPKHGPQSYYRCALPTCSKRDKMWSRKDNFKAHITRMHKGMNIDVDRLIASSEFEPTFKDIAFMARSKGTHAHSKMALHKAKARRESQQREITAGPSTEASAHVPLQQNAGAEVGATQVPEMLWQTHVPDFVDEMPREAADMAAMRWDQGGSEPGMYTYEGQLGPLGSHSYGYSIEGAWEDLSDTSWAFSQGSSSFGGGMGDFG